ncbi:hypothetical protein GKA01_08160 [Gluconobacter kanchanaburiensis NBRC 103587]|uniref:Uncharacterized protein n=1 Tax=Gluconobacter kanchanaburiensis NBRC 103587 TaxID=1307948 RepID=A0A511B5A5_9PROT|nr:hypothetical protein AA103587_0540 [Gluconobacter kanchanaburiensis NBRC 103587]GEK95619.1 hypothetical protein GKA01_08160 [Gluconobacter kanchanaburiensis NBRC 103587]
MEKIQAAEHAASRQPDFLLGASRYFRPESKEPVEPQPSRKAGHDGHWAVSAAGVVAEVIEGATAGSDETGRGIMNLPNRGGGCHDDRDL